MHRKKEAKRNPLLFPIILIALVAFATSIARINYLSLVSMDVIVVSRKGTKEYTNVSSRAYNFFSLIIFKYTFHVLAPQ